MRDHFYNTHKLTRFILKRELVSTIIWLTILVLLTVGVAYAFENMLFETAEARLAMAETMKNPAMTVLVGPGYGIDDYTTGAMMSHQMLLFTMVAVAIMNIFLVVSHTRKDEEAGRLEVIRSLPVGRLSKLSATMIVCVIVNTILSLLIAFSLYALGITGMTLWGCFLYGVALGLGGFIFGVIAAVFAQLSSTSRGAIGYSFMFLGFAYILRGIGDVSVEALSLISPLGLPLRAAPFVYDNWGHLLILKLIAFAIMIFAFYLNSKRDLGAGLIPAKKGKANANHTLLSPFGYAKKMVLVTLIWWGISLFILGATYGSVFGDIDTFMESNEMFQQIFGSEEINITMAESFTSVIMIVMAMFAAIPAISAILKLRKEEKEGRLEHILSRNVSRPKILACFLVIALITSAAMIILTGLGLWVAAASVMNDPISLTTVMSIALVQVPAILLMVGIAVFLIGWLPRLYKWVWGYLGFSLFAVYFGMILDFPDWTKRISPFGNIPQIPVEEFAIMPILILTLISIILFILGFIGYKRRDIVN